MTRRRFHPASTCLTIATLVLSAGLSSLPVTAQAQAAQPASIVIQTFDVVTNQLVPSGKFYNGQRVRLEAHAFDASGNSIPCSNPGFSAKKDVGGDLVSFAGGMMTAAASGFGSTEVVATCSNLPGVSSTPMYTSVMAQGQNLGTANAGLGLRRTANAPTTGTGTAAASGGHKGLIIGLAIGGAALIVGAAVAIAGGISSGSGSSYSGSSCPVYSDYCTCGSGCGGGVRQSGCSCPSGTTTATCGSSNGNCGGLYPAGTVLCNC